MRAVFWLTGLVGMILFFLPVLTGGIINIGNVTGLLVSACLFLYACFYHRAGAVLSAGWQRGGAVRGLLLAGAVLLAAVVLTVLVLTGMMIRAACREPAPEASVVILGCEVKGERPSLMLRSRMDAAVDWLQDHPEACCVASGGKGQNEKISEAECMVRYLTEHGIAGDRILPEDRSVSTRENLLFSSRILEEKGAGEHIAVVTNEFHACRAVLIARKLGLEAGVIPAPSPWWLLPTFYVRELYGLLYQIFSIC